MGLKDYNYELVLEYIETGAKGELKPEQIEYITILEAMRAMYDRYENPASIKRFFTNKPYNLSPFQANKWFNEMINLFHQDNSVKKSAWRNLYAERLDNAAELIIATSTKPSDIEIYIKAVNSAGKMRGLDESDPPEIPKALFDKPTKIYSMNPEFVGRSKANRNILAQQIDNMELSSLEKSRLRQDAMVDEIEFLDGDDDGEEIDN